MNEKTRILAVANQKGGVGKTTVAVNLATALAALDRDVLIIDLDPQGNAGTGLGVPHAQRDRNSHLLLNGRIGIEDAVAVEIPRLRILPASPDLIGVDAEFADHPRRAQLLADRLADGDKPDTVLIDCPPALGLLTLNALIAADAVLIPMQCEFFALEGLSQLLKTIDRVKHSLNARLTIQGVVLSMFDRRNKLSHQVAEDLRRHFGDKVYETAIPRNVRVSEAPSHGKPAIVYDFRCPGSQAYLRLAREIIEREDLERARPRFVSPDGIPTS